MFEAPKELRKSAWSSFPVTAVTSEPSFDKSITETDPTPPVDPVTIDLVSLKPAHFLKLSSACTDKPAVSPAVPNDIDCFSLSPFGK